MCHLILAPQGSNKLSFETFQQAAKRNGDGFGIAVANGRSLEIYKTMRRLDKVYKLYERAHQEGHSSLIHFRLGTSGTLSTRNVHPFRTHKDCVLGHNGILYNEAIYAFQKTKEGRKDCDTKIFAERFVARFPSSETLKDPLVTGILEDAIGEGNKVALLFADGSYRLLGWDNPSCLYDGGNYHSNRDHLPTVPMAKHVSRTWPDDHVWRVGYDAQLDSTEEANGVTSWRYGCRLGGDPLCYPCLTDWRGEFNGNEPQETLTPARQGDECMFCDRPLSEDPCDIGQRCIAKNKEEEEEESDRSF